MARNWSTKRQRTTYWKTELGVRICDTIPQAVVLLNCDETWNISLQRPFLCVFLVILNTAAAHNTIRICCAQPHTLHLPLPAATSTATSKYPFVSPQHQQHTSAHTPHISTSSYIQLPHPHYLSIWKTNPHYTPGIHHLFHSPTTFSTTIRKHSSFIHHPPPLQTFVQTRIIPPSSCIHSSI